MYRLYDEHQAKAAKHYSQYNKAFAAAVSNFLTGLPDGCYAKQLLEGAKDENNDLVRVLLMGSFEEQKTLIKKIDEDLNILVGVDPDAKKNFIEQMKKLFVDGMYDNNKFFSKSEHVKRVDIEICPYCGRSYIYFAEHPTKSNSKTMVKPAIDHFLPKDVYPYLAVNYYNLIPSCTTCNNSPCKWTHDPIGDTRDKEYLMHPYLFDDDKIGFSYLPTTMLYNKEHIKVKMDCDNTDLDEGYKKWLNLDQFYGKHNGMVKNMYIQLSGLQKAYQKFTGRTFSVPKAFIDGLPIVMFGYDLAPERAKEELMYKFKKDIFVQLRKDLYKV